MSRISAADSGSSKFLFWIRKNYARLFVRKCQRDDCAQKNIEYKEVEVGGGLRVRFAFLIDPCCFLGV